MLFSMPLCGGFSPAAAAHIMNWLSAMWPMSCPIERTSGVALNAYRFSGTFSAVRASTPLIMPNCALAAAVAGVGLRERGRRHRDGDGTPRQSRTHESHQDLQDETNRRA